MAAEQLKKPRPYWHVDAKWIAGLLLAGMLSLTLLTYGLVQVTAEQPAVEALTLATALMNSPKGLDDETDIALLGLALQLSPGGSLQPIPGMRISLDAQEIEGLSPRQIRLLFFQKWAVPVYQQGVQGLADLADDPALRAQILEQGAMLDLLTLQTHQALQRGLLLFGAISLVLLIPLVLFSRGFGRVFSPGCAFFFASLPGVILFTVMGAAIQPAAAPPAGDDAFGMLTYLASHVLPSMARTLNQPYLLFLLLGIGLMALGLLSGIIWNLIRWNKA